MSTPLHNVDPAELARFNAIAQRWWDPEGEMGALHRINPLRLAYLAERAPLASARVLDVGCGGGLLSEALARAGAQVTGIDLAPAALEVARLHALEAGLTIDYRETTVEALAEVEPGRYDIVTCMEMLEHVPNPASVIAAIGRLTRPGGHVFLSTINRTAKAFALAIVGAEYLLGWLPKGTHEYARFLKPSELGRAARAAGLSVRDVSGLTPVLPGRDFRLSRDPSVNFLVHLSRPGLKRP